MAEKHEAMFNSVKPLCVGYIKATHLLSYLPFLRAKAGLIHKAHKNSCEDGFRVMYDALIESDTEDKWRKYSDALAEAEFNSICELYKFMDKQEIHFDHYCNIFDIFSNAFTEDRLNVIEFANTLKSTQTITEGQLQTIEQLAEKEGKSSAAILLLAYFPCSLPSLMQGLNDCLNIMGKEDLWKDINKVVTYLEDEENTSGNYMEQMIKHCHKDIIECVHPRDIWDDLSTDLHLPKNNIEFSENRKSIEKIMDLFEESTYPGKFESLYRVLSDSGYEHICSKIKQRPYHEDENNHYKQLIKTNHQTLISRISVKEILDPLFQAKVINKRDQQEIAALNENKGNINAAQCLLETIPLKKDRWCYDFFIILIKNNQRNLVMEIDPSFDVIVDNNLDTSVDTNFGKDYGCAQTNVVAGINEYKLRKYQEELISKALLGKNCIIASRTGSGKTVMAMKIIEDHFAKSNNKSCKVVFLCNQTSLADQQHTFLGKAFPHLKVWIIYGFSESQSKKIDIFLSSDIIVMTPQCLVDDLQNGRIKNFSIITLLIIDECHHTYSKHPYNILMSRYIDDKTEKANCQLPQVIGLTALVGIDVTKSNKNAREHIIEICANLDCDELCAVKENIDELNEYIKTPDEYIMPLERENDCTFSKIIKEFMSVVHTSLNNAVFHGESVCYGTAQYIGWLSNSKKIVEASSVELKHEFASLRLLENCHSALQLVKGYRVLDALELLRNYLYSETLDTDAFQNLKILINNKLDDFEKHSTRKELEAESSCLVKLVDKIMENFREEPDSRVMVFTETREMAKILKNVLIDKRETNDLNPQYLMSGMNRDKGVGMSINRQKDALELFQSGECKLLVSTPVGEEGLDITKCNLVIDYMTVTGVRSHVQKRGRARAANSKYILIIGADPALNKRAHLNILKADLMYIALYEAFDLQTNNPIQFKESVKKAQSENRLQGRKIVKRLNDTHIFTLKCISCNNFAAESVDFRVIEDKCYVIVNPDFRKNIIILKTRSMELFDNIRAVSRFYCRECKHYWGIQVSYKNTVFDCIKIKHFKIFNEKNEHVVVKKWLKVPFKEAVAPISEEDFVRVQEADNIENILSGTGENLPNSESNSDEN